MSDLISRQAAIDVLEERLQANGYSNAALVSEFNRSIGYLMWLPSAQPEIIRCKECKYSQQCKKAVEHITYAPTSVTIGYKSVDFCSHAERRTDEQTD